MPTFPGGPEADEVLLEVGLGSGVEGAGRAESDGWGRLMLVKVLHQFHLKVVVR